MRFHVVHKLVSYLLAIAAVATLVSTGTVPIPTLGLLLVFGVVSWFVEPGNRLGRLLDRAELVFNLGALAFFAVSLYEVVRSFPEPDLTPVLNLVLFLLVYKLLHRRSNRDYLQVYVLSFLVVLAGAWLAQTVLFVIGFCSYVVIATWTLILFHLRHEIEDNYLVKHLPDSAEKVTAARVLNSRRVVGRSFFLVTGLVGVAVLVGAALVFAMVPRVGLGFLSGATRRRMSIVGFSDEVTLGQHGVISRDNETVVLRAQVPHIADVKDAEDRWRTISTLYWRGTVYDRYEQGQWVRSRRSVNATALTRVPTATGGWAYMLDPSELQARRRNSGTVLKESQKQIIQVVGLSFPVAFALDQPVAFEMIPPLMGSFVTTDFSGKFSGEVALKPIRMFPSGRTDTLSEFNGGQYIAYSRSPAPRAGVGKEAVALPPALLASYLDVPAAISPRMRDLARTIVANSATPMAKVQAVTEWLRKTHSYTVDLKRDTTIADPLEDFLFKQNAGHCEYFASAAAILLRLAGVPTRYINGFLGGEWNDIGKHITVRDNRAHSWVEAYLGTFGWVRVDATPVSSQAAPMGRIAQLFDAIELFWAQWVILYDASRQLDIAKRIGKGLGMGGAKRGSTGWKPDKRLIWVVAGLAGLIMIARYVKQRGWRRGRGAGARLRGGPAIFRLYRRVLDRLAARGWSRQPAETPAEFAARLARVKVPGADVLTRLSSLYAAARYGERDIPEATVTELTDAIDQIAEGRTNADGDPPAAAA